MTMQRTGSEGNGHASPPFAFDASEHDAPVPQSLYPLTPKVWEWTHEFDLAFPQVDPGYVPAGSRILVQLRTAKAQSKGGIWYIDDSKDTERDTVQTARVIALGPLAYRKRDTGERWIEGDYCAPGQFVRVPRYGGDRMDVALPRKPDLIHPDTGERIPAPQEYAHFVIFDDHNVTAQLTSMHPLDAKAYL